MTEISRTDWLELNGPGVVCDVVGDEVVFVNLESGAYYSTEGAGAAIWRLLAEGRTIDGAIRGIGARYAGDAAEIERDVRAFVDRLVSESLVRIGSGAAPAAAPPDEDPSADRPRFPGIVFQKYVDLEELLLLDPIHEATDAGWPNAKKA